MAVRKPKKVQPQVTEQQWRLLRSLAVTLEKGRFNDYVETLQRSRKLLWSGFLGGLAKGFGAVIGATIVVALVAAILTALGQNIRGDIGDFFTKTSQKIEQTSDSVPR